MTQIERIYADLKILFCFYQRYLHHLRSKHLSSEWC